MRWRTCPVCAQVVAVLWTCTGQSAWGGIWRAFQNSCAFVQPNKTCESFLQVLGRLHKPCCVDDVLLFRFVLHLILSWEISHAKNLTLGGALFFQKKFVQVFGVECSLFRALYSMAMSRSPFIFIIGLRLWSFPSVRECCVIIWITWTSCSFAWADCRVVSDRKSSPS